MLFQRWLRVLALALLLITAAACSPQKSKPSSPADAALTGEYAVVDLRSGAVKNLNSAPSDLLSNNAYKTTKLVLRRIGSGTFDMGDEDGDGSSRERPVHSVRISELFYIGVFELTQGQWSATMNSQPSQFSANGETRPVESISWNDICGGAGLTATLSQLTGLGFDLPTEAQWEYACKAGTTTAFNTESAADGDGFWYAENSNGQTHPVGLNQPNAFGLYDCHGNVWEWCRDRYVPPSDTEPSYYALCHNAGTAIDPSGSDSGADRIVRGGGWGNGATYCRSSSRSWRAPNSQASSVGARLVAVQKRAPKIMSSAPERVVVGQLYSYSIEATGSPAPCITVSGLPSWLTYNPINRTISGVLTEDTLGIRINFTISASNGVGFDAVQQCVIKVSELSGLYVVIDLQCPYTIINLSSTPEDLLTNDAYKTTKLVMRRISAGTFLMGNETYPTLGGFPIHPVRISSDFYIGVFEVTERQWYQVMGPALPRIDFWYYLQGGKFPVEWGIWSDIKSDSGFIETLSSMVGESFNLPTEAEWEYCCKAGTGLNYSFGSNENQLLSIGERLYEINKYMWWSKNNYYSGRYGPKEVGTRLPNPWGLYDMHGNVREWCLDWHSWTFYQECYNNGTVSDPIGPATGNYRVNRGGDYQSSTECGSMYRYCFPESSCSGFRIVAACSRSPYYYSSAPAKAWVGEEYKYEIIATGKPVPSLSFSNLPGWLSFDGQNTISGIPAISDIGPQGTITITASNGFSPDAVQSFALTVSDLGFQGQYAIIDLRAPYTITDLSSTPVDLTTNDEYKTTKMVLKRIPSGTFQMGDDRIDNSRAHTVNISKHFYIGVFEVSQRQWFEVMGTWPSYFTSDRDKRPVEQISWNDIKGSSGFIDTISQRTGRPFDLPTEAEWEYCCRAGTNSYFSFGDLSGGAYMWSGSNSDTGNGEETHEVGTKLPNPWGLYDMHGNVCEWCLDYFSYFYYEICINSGIVFDPEGSSAGSTRIFRGGSFNGYSSLSAVRYNAYPYYQSNGIGLRVVLVRRDN